MKRAVFAERIDSTTKKGLFALKEKITKRLKSNSNSIISKISRTEQTSGPSPFDIQNKYPGQCTFM